MGQGGCRFTSLICNTAEDGGNGAEVLTGLWASSAHWKQKAAPHLQLMSSGSPPTSALASMAFSHPAAIHASDHECPSGTSSLFW